MGQGGQNNMEFPKKGEDSSPPEEREPGFRRPMGEISSE